MIYKLFFCCWIIYYSNLLSRKFLSMCNPSVTCNLNYNDKSTYGSTSFDRSTFNRSTYSLVLITQQCWVSIVLLTEEITCIHEIQQFIICMHYLHTWNTTVYYMHALCMATNMQVWLKICHFHIARFTLGNDSYSYVHLWHFHYS